MAQRVDQRRDQRRDQRGAPEARQAILARLRREWPDSLDLTARSLVPPVPDSDFLAACVALQDEGMIMYEALLVGTGPSPMLVAAVLTRKGQAASLEDR